jgi:hypothetical protein
VTKSVISGMSSISDNVKSGVCMMSGGSGGDDTRMCWVVDHSHKELSLPGQAVSPFWRSFFAV